MKAAELKNKDGNGVWEFVNLADRKALDQFDVTTPSTDPISVTFETGHVCP